jgi:hypothetical protein
MAVRDDDPALLDAINDMLRNRQAEIDLIIKTYHVPMLPINDPEAAFP